MNRMFTFSATAQPEGTTEKKVPILSVRNQGSTKGAHELLLAE